MYAQILDLAREETAVRIALSTALTIGAVLVSEIATRALGGAVAGWARRTDAGLGDKVSRRTASPLRWIGRLSAVAIVLPTTDLPSGALATLQHVFVVLIIASITWLLAAGIGVVQDVTRVRFDVRGEDNLRARAVRTQVKALGNVATFAVVLLGFSFALMTFDSVRQFGVTLLASAGAAGIVVGFAAQKSLGALFAGIQLAITQPIRVDDVVVLEGAFGRIEEIALTYVVVRVWDSRRLIVPINYFTERPFENWTRTSSELLCAVTLHADYRTPVEPIRSELDRVLRASGAWDGRTCKLEVTGSTPQTIELRALMSATDSSNAWNLRCLVREKLVRFVAESLPEGLPHLRAEISGNGSRGRKQRMALQDGPPK